jgi:hypothetical protein
MISVDMVFGIFFLVGARGEFEDAAAGGGLLEDGFGFFVHVRCCAARIGSWDGRIGG